MQVLLHPSAGKYLEHLNEPMKGRIKAALKNLEKEPLEGDIKPLAGQPGYFRLRVGSYRVLFRVAENIRVHKIATRGQAYKE